MLRKPLEGIRDQGSYHGNSGLVLTVSINPDNLVHDTLQRPRDTFSSSERNARNMLSYVERTSVCTYFFIFRARRAHKFYTKLFVLQTLTEVTRLHFKPQLSYSTVLILRRRRIFHNARNSLHRAHESVCRNITKLEKDSSYTRP